VKQYLEHQGTRTSVENVKKNVNWLDCHPLPTILDGVTTLNMTTQQ
jgi:hypothetical protein